MTALLLELLGSLVGLVVVVVLARAIASQSETGSLPAKFLGAHRRGPVSVPRHRADA